MKTAEEILLEFYNQASLNIGGGKLNMEQWQNERKNDNEIAELANAGLSAMKAYASQAIDECANTDMNITIGKLTVIGNRHELDRESILKVKQLLK